MARISENLGNDSSLGAPFDGEGPGKEGAFARVGPDEVRRLCALGASPVRSVPVTSDDYPFRSSLYREFENRVSRIVPAFVLPNHLTLFRIAVCMFLVWRSSSLSNTAFIVLACVAGVSDYLDGVVARARNQKTRFGIVLDPVADKLLVAAVLLILLERGFVDTTLVVLMFAGESHLLFAPLVYFLGTIVRRRGEGQDPKGNSVPFPTHQDSRPLYALSRLSIRPEGIKPSIFGKIKMHLYLFGLVFIVIGTTIRYEPLSDMGRWIVFTGVGFASVAAVLYIVRFARNPE